ncbi:YjfA family protein [Bacillus sp. 3103sda1]|uniref:DUF2690 domain-containing protein n=1 Tax=Bacillus sp. 3103sda1 TaxID=2953808 RepID=UPI0020A1BF64|nr:DUF2690 domain-containing protein [Bacillus sp. 3103sda1]MCP1124302.1 YjfA family protein [Bacillus sp. 3103sda1]
MKKFITATLGLVIALSTFFFNSGTTYAAVANGSDPIATGCARDAKTIPDLYNTSWYSGAMVELRYSPTCRSAWAKLTLGGDPAAREGWAQIKRSDGVTYSYYAKKSLGQTSCYTKQVNDAGYIANARANVYFSSGHWEYLYTGWY